MKKALIIVDLNNDFMPGGALAVKEADQVIAIINDLAQNDIYDFVVATQDWHPANHSSFQTWPQHCVAGTPGAELHPLFDTSNVHALFRKGYDPEIDSYSGFYNEKGETNGLAEMLKARNIENVDVVGIATDYCVKATAIEAATIAGLNTRVLLRACRGVGINKNDVPNAILAMEEAGVNIIEQ
jgi:nicotinamidase/pyrazinamidase